MKILPKTLLLKPAQQALAALAVALASQAVHAGSFDDFFTRIIRDDAPGITALVKRGFDPNTVNERGETGLTQAFKLDSYRAAKGLIDQLTA